MTYRIIVEPTAEREIRSAVRWKTENASLIVAARWYNGLIRKRRPKPKVRASCRAGCEVRVASMRAPYRPI